MKKIHKNKFLRKDNKNLYIYGFHKFLDSPAYEITVDKIAKPHMRWNPSRQEWVTYSAGRKNRTTFPKKEYCPLCPSIDINNTTEIPFKNFEIAVFPNRWPSFNSISENLSVKHLETKPSKGECEVIVYSSDHQSTLAEMPIKRIELLINVWIDRYKFLYKKNNIKYVLPFENRGEECGVTLHHPHGQIYAFPFIPPVIKKEIKAFRKENFIINILHKFGKKYFTYQNKHFIAAVPPFARYAYEIWIIPRKKIPGPWKLNSEEIEYFAKTIKKVVKGYDNFFGKRCPYIMGLHSSPDLEDKNFHFHVEFYPPLRHGNKPKVLAGSESMAGVFIMDVLPEDSARELRKYMK